MSPADEIPGDDARRHEVEELARRARELATALETRGKEIEQLNRNERELVRALDVRGREVEELNRSVRALSEGLNGRGREVETLHAKVRELEGALGRRGGEVEALHEALRSHSGEISRLEREFLAGAGGSPPPAASSAAPGPSAAGREATAGVLGLRRRPANIAALAWTLARTDVKIRYHGTWAGFLWALLKPVAILGVLMTVFSLMFTETPDYKLRLVLGLFLWDYFAEGTRVGLLSLLAKGALLTKMPLPHWIVVLTSRRARVLTLSVFVGGFLLASWRPSVASRAPPPCWVFSSVSCSSWSRSRGWPSRCRCSSCATATSTRSGRSSPRRASFSPPSSTPWT